MIVGDFNNVLKMTDRIGGHMVQVVEYADLEKMMKNGNLFEHDTKGPQYTWSNKQPIGLIFSKIDRALCNTEWFLTFPKCVIDVLNPHIYITIHH